MYYVYVLKSRSRDEIYVGSTNDLRRRLAEHNSGAEISTRRYLPWVVLYYEAYATEELARLREQRLKYNGNALRELKKRIGLHPAPLSAIRKSGAGFTLLEVLIYLAIVGATLAAATTLAVTLVESDAHGSVRATVDTAGGRVLTTLAEVAHGATALDAAASSFDTDQGRVTFIMRNATRSPTSLRLTGTQMEIAEGGGAFVPLTPDDVEVTVFRVTSLLPAGARPGVRVTLSVRFRNPGTDPTYDFAQTYVTGVVLR